MIGFSALTMTAGHYQQVYNHLFPGDGLEAAAVLVCARVPGSRIRLLVRDVLLVPYESCANRAPDWLTWPGMAIEQGIDLAEADDLALILMHSHPGGLFAFSEQDDESDRATMPGLFQALGPLHGSAIMTPNGAILARLYGPDMQPRAIHAVSVAGDDLKWWWGDGAFAQRPLAFTSETRDELSRLCACVIGVSGTGSIVAEQIARLGFGQVQLIDFDKLEFRNLNRILNSTLAATQSKQFKVLAFAEAIALHRGEGVAVPLAASINSREAVLLASQADVLFCCVDTLEARHIADLMSSAFLLPMFDVGVAIPTRKAGGGRPWQTCAGASTMCSPGDRHFKIGVFTIRCLCVRSI